MGGCSRSTSPSPSSVICTDAEPGWAHMKLVQVDLGRCRHSGALSTDEQVREGALRDGRLQVLLVQAGPVKHRCVVCKQGSAQTGRREAEWF